MNWALKKMMPSPASFSARLMAFSIDMVLLVGLYSVSMIILTATSITTLHQEGLVLLPLATVFMFVAPIIIPAFYFCLLHTLGGQTLGKLFMEIQVVSREQRTLSLGEAFLRWCGTGLSFFSFGLGFLWILFDHQNSSWHDILACSKVINLSAHNDELKA